MSQAIVTTYYGPTNTKPGRIKATIYSPFKVLNQGTGGGYLTAWMNYNHGINQVDNHRAAVRKLALDTSIPWFNPDTATLIGADLGPNSMVWIKTNNADTYSPEQDKGL